MSDLPETYEDALEQLTEMQRAFVIAYSGNRTEAADIAGYSSPGQAGYRLLKNVQIQHALKLRDQHEAAIVAKKAVNSDVQPTRPEVVSEVAAAKAPFSASRIDRMEQLEHVRLTREELECFLSGVVVGAVEEHGVGLTGDPWSGPPKLRDRLKAAEMLAKMNHWNASEGGGEKDETADPYGHSKLTREEINKKAWETARKLILLEGGG